MIRNIDRISSLFILLLLFSCSGKKSALPPLPSDEVVKVSAGKFGAPSAIRVPDKWENLPTRFRPFNAAQISATPFDSTAPKPFTVPVIQIPLRFSDFEARPFAADSLPARSFTWNWEKIHTTSHPANLVAKPGKKWPLYSFNEVIGDVACTVVFEDSKHMIWLGTNTGLYRWDGTLLQLWVGADRMGSCMGIIENEKGQLLATDANSGLFIIDPAVMEMHQFATNTTLFTSKIVKALYDKQGRIWVTGQPPNNGFNIIDTKTKSISFIPNEAVRLSPDAFLGDLALDRDSILYSCASKGGLIRIHSDSMKVYALSQPPGAGRQNDTMQLLSVLVDENNTLWFGSNGGPFAAWHANRDSLSVYLESGHGIKHGNTLEMYRDKNGRIWRGADHVVEATGSGVMIVDPINKEYDYISMAEGLSGTKTLHIIQDHLGQMWLPTSKGVNMLPGPDKLFKRAGSAAVSTMAEDDQGKVWLGTLNDGMRYIDPAANETRSLRRKEGISDSLIQFVRNVGNDIWIATNKGTDVVRSDRKTIAHLGKPPASKYDVSFIAQGLPSGDVLYGGNPNSGLDIVSADLQKVKSIGVAQGWTDSTILDIKKAKQGGYYFFSATKGLGYLDEQMNSVKYLTVNPWPKKPMYDGVITIDNSNHIWLMAGDMGISCVSPSGDSIYQINTAQFSVDLNAIVTKGDEVYVTTRSGLIRITTPFNGGKKWDIYYSGDRKGLEKTAASYASDLINRDGEYWMGDFGVIRIPHPKNLTGDGDSSTTIITRVSNFNEEMGRLDTLKNQLYHLPVSNRFSQERNDLQFSFSRVGIANTGNTRFRYFLKGVDSVWSPASTSISSRYYPKIPVGDYEFLVSSNIGHGWSTPAAYAFTIKPFWYRTWWAMLIFAAIGGLLVWQGYTFLHNQRLKRDNQQLEATVQKRTQALQQSLDDLKATQEQLVHAEKMASLGELTAGIAHEIQNPLNFVNNFSELSAELVTELKEEIQQLHLTPDQETPLNDIMADLQQNQEKITLHGKRAESIVKGMLQHSRNSTGQKEPVDINQLVDEYQRLSYHGLRAKDKSFNSDVKTNYASGLPPVQVIQQDLGRVFLNILNNAFYAVHQRKITAGEGYKPMVEVTTRRLPQGVEISIRDNGSGMPPAVMQKVFQPFFTTKPTGQGTGLGLSISYDIITKGHQGELLVQSEENNFTEFLIRLPV